MDNQLKLGTTFQVRLVSDLKKSQEYYRDILGCTVDNWGHAERDGMLVILQQAMSPEDVRPNSPSKKRSDYPTDWNGPDYGWDTFVHVSWNDIDAIVEDIRSRGGIVTLDPVAESHGRWEFKNYYIQDPDKYSIVLGAMREVVR
ncbi:VOC family protein [Paenibacillus sp. N1-5-1-14]|uniref:VOC family protein n=1 Tax=Paenibacillus radicibacter TaxID=2972488 RepID=UPI002158A8AB|nr:VOC family protein [Paenibacillus radicibacter]MCR8642021.1 VOC family protein [Paenibacillus radicibacter]